MPRTYWIRKSPTGHFFGRPAEFRCEMDDPEIPGNYNLYDEYKRKLKKMGWTIVNVKLVEIKP